MNIRFKLTNEPEINKDEDKNSVENKALEEENVRRNIQDKDIVKIIVVPNKIVNIVVK